MFPLKERKLIRGAAGHLAAGLGIGADYEAMYKSLYAPFSGVGSTFHGPQGGKWYKLKLLDGSRIEFAHLSEYKKLDKVKEGDEIAITGNTGKITTGPHLHIQAFDKNGKRVDPEKIVWDNKDMETEKSRIIQLTAQVKRLQDESRKLTNEVLTEKTRYEREVENHKDTLEHLKGCEKSREIMAGEGREAKSLFERIRSFFT